MDGLCPRQSRIPMVPAVHAALRITNYIAANGRVRGAPTADALGLNRSTCHGILKTLVTGGWLAFDEQSKEYWLGPGLTALGARAWQAAEYVAVARPFLQRWVSDTGFTIFLVEPLPSGEFVVVDKVDSTLGFHLTVGLGQRFPLVTGAMGKAHLGSFPDQEAERLVADHGLYPYTERSIVDMHRYLREVRRAKRDKWAASRGEFYVGSNAVAAAVRDSHGRPVFVVASMASERLLTDEVLPQYGERLKALAGRIEGSLLAGPLWSQRTAHRQGDRDQYQRGVVPAVTPEGHPDTLHEGGHHGG